MKKIRNQEQKLLRVIKVAELLAPYESSNEMQQNATANPDISVIQSEQTPLKTKYS